MNELATREKHQDSERLMGHSELFSSTEKREAIVAATARLQVLFSRPDQTQLPIYAEVLGDLPASLLARAYMLAERTCDRMPTPSVLRRLVGCDGMEAETDAAFTWLTHYLRFHGVDGHAMSGEIVFEDGEVKGKRPNTPAPTMPDRITRTLESLGGSVRKGLERINECEPAQMGYLRRDFAQAFSRSQFVEEL